jgi:hypothetical protein
MFQTRLPVFAFGCAFVFLPLNQVDAQRRLTPLENVATSADLPKKAVRGGAWSEVQAEFDISAEGRAENCMTTYAVKPWFRDVTCKLIEERMRYIPAHDASGKSVRGRDMINVYWAAPPSKTMVGLTDYGGARPKSAVESWMRLPTMSRAPLDRGSAYVRFEIATDGSVGQCAILSVMGDQKVAEHLCKSLQALATFRSPVDEKGQPFAVIGSVKYDWLGTKDIPAYRRR